MNYDFINPGHYQDSHKELWEMMIDLFGKEEYTVFCRLNAFKYRMRAGKKPGQPPERDIEKAMWYENKIKEILK